eukprot:TRINITY_DN66156_c0_g1_i1.p1 TRINITY_DN66156_c0_g1~~TRINITY_DN66156_c0_g1_i1.p1  ORF type:complete len:283 (+),score=81.86 TRINITY_DN66156_c0_g1_i1:67-915(+)
MGAQVSEELAAWASVTDLAAMTVKMKILPALPAECQIEVLRRLWRSLRWLSSGTDLITPREMNDRLFVIVQGEAEAILSSSSYIVLLPEGTFACEAALLGHQAASSTAGSEPRELLPLRYAPSPKRWPEGVLGIIKKFLVRDTSWPSFPGRIRTTRRSLIATLARPELLQVVEGLQGEERQKSLDLINRSRGQVAHCNPLQNITYFGDAKARPLGAHDMAALRVVCEGPMALQAVCSGPSGLQAACRNITLRASPAFDLFQSCQGQGVSSSPEHEDADAEGL